MYYLDYPGNVLVAVSLFFSAVFVMLVLVDRNKPYIKLICESLFLISLSLFILGVFV